MSQFITNAELRIEAERLVNENEKLRKDMEDLESYDQILRDRLRKETELQVKSNAENAKLRELVEDMLDCIEIRAAFNRPPTTDMYEQFAKRASELGVEVDEDVDC